MKEKKKNWPKIFAFISLGFLFIVIIIAIFGDDPDDANRPAISQKIKDIIEKNPLEADRKRDVKITYTMNISQDEFLSLTEDEAKTLLQAVYDSAPNRNCCARAFLSVYVRGMSSISPGGWKSEDGKLDLTTFMWKGYQCSAKKALKNPELIKKVVHDFYNNATKLALNFINQYGQGINVGPLQKKAERMYTGWNDNEFYKLLPETCFAFIPDPYGKVKSKALNLVSSIHDTLITKKITRLNIQQIKKQYKETLAAGLAVGL